MKPKLRLYSARFLSLLIIFSVCCPVAYAGDDGKQAASASGAEIEQAMTHIGPVLQAHFPRAKITKTAKSVHFEFKGRNFATASGEVLSPQTDGIVGDIEVKTGKYKGKHTLPQTIHETLFITILWAPYSEAQDCHVLTKVLFPHDLDISVINEFKAAMEEFVTATEASNTQKVAEAPPEKKPEPVASVTVKQPAASSVSAAAPSQELAQTTRNPRMRCQRQIRLQMLPNRL